MRVSKFLKEHDVRFELIVHRPTYDAQHLAEAIHTPGDEVAKTVLLRADGDYALAVLPATHLVDMDRMRQALEWDRVELATELEFRDLFPDCETGALPPFGSQYGLTTIVDNALAGDEIVFEGNTHDEAFCMKFEDYRRIEKPLLAEFSERLVASGTA